MAAKKKPLSPTPPAKKQASASSFRKKEEESKAKAKLQARVDSKGRGGMGASKPKSTSGGDKPGPWDNIARGLKTGERFVREVSGVADVERFVKNPRSVKNAASLGLTVAAYAAGPLAKANQITKAAKAANKINKTMEARAAMAAAEAEKATRTINAYKGAGTITTKGKSTVSMTGIKSFTTGKNPVRAAASTRVQVSKDAQQAYKDVKALKQKNVTRGKMAAVGLAGGKTASTASVVKQENKKKKK